MTGYDRPAGGMRGGHHLTGDHPAVGMRGGHQGKAQRGMFCFCATLFTDHARPADLRDHLRQRQRGGRGGRGGLGCQGRQGDLRDHLNQQRVEQQRVEPERVKDRSGEEAEMFNSFRYWREPLVHIEDIAKSELLKPSRPACLDIRKEYGGRKLEEEEQEIKVFNNPGKIQKFKITDQEIGFSVSDACELSAIKIEVIKSVSRVEVNIFRASDNFVKLQNRGSLKKSVFSYVNSQKKKVTFAYPLKLRGKKNYVLNLTMEHGTVEVAQLENERQVIDRAGEVRITGTETSIKSLFIK